MIYYLTGFWGFGVLGFWAQGLVEGFAVGVLQGVGLKCSGLVVWWGFRFLQGFGFRVGGG